MKVDLDQLHQKSINNVLFYTDESVLNNLTSTFNFLFTRNAVFLVQNNNFGMTFRKIPNIPYTNLDLLEFSNYDAGMKSHVPKADKNYLEIILKGFKYVQDKVKQEIFMILYWDTNSKTFVLRIPEDQIISSVNDKYEYPDEEHNDRFIRYLEIHSHHSMGAKFSGGSGDDYDESNKPTCFYGVIGSLSGSTNIYNFSSSFRVWNGYDFTYVDPSDVFDIPEVKNKVAPSWMTNILDKIIENSKNSNNNVMRNYYIPTSNNSEVPKPYNPYSNNNEDKDILVDDQYVLDHDGDMIDIEDYMNKDEFYYYGLK